MHGMPYSIKVKLPVSGGTVFVKNKNQKSKIIKG
jgi:hypothetical protein